MQELIDGIHRFQREGFLPLQQLFVRLSKGQHPATLFITCSDARIDPTLLTNSQPGDLFILRNAGNIIPPHGAGKGSGEAATIEFAVAELGVKDIIVCGHSHCGAMRGLLKPETLQFLPDFTSWLAHAEMTRRIITDNCLVNSSMLARIQLSALTEFEVGNSTLAISQPPRFASQLEQLPLDGFIHRNESFAEIHQIGHPASDSMCHIGNATIRSLRICDRGR